MWTSHGMCSYYRSKSGNTYTWVMSSIWTRRDTCSCTLQMWIYGYISHVIHTNESCLSYKRVMSIIRTSHLIHTNESCASYERVVSFIRTSHVTDTNESCHSYERVMSLIRTSHVTHTNESLHVQLLSTGAGTRTHADCLQLAVLLQPYLDKCLNKSLRTMGKQALTECMQMCVLISIPKGQVPPPPCTLFTPPLHLLLLKTDLFWSLCLPNEILILAYGWVNQSEIWMSRESPPPLCTYSYLILRFEVFVYRMRYSFWHLDETVSLTYGWLMSHKSHVFVRRGFFCRIYEECLTHK